MKSARGLLKKGLALAGSFTNVPSIRSNAIKRAFVLLAITALPCLAFAGKTPTPIIYVSAVTDSSVSLYWTDAVSGEIDWTLERATVSTGPFIEIAQLAPNTTNYTDTTVLPGTTYYYRAGYMSSKGATKTSGTLKVKTQVRIDTTPPTVTVTAPAAGQVLGGTITVSATATDNVNVSSVEFFINGASVGRDTNSPFSIAFDTRTIASGSCALVAKAKDPAGNTGTSSTVTFICDNTAPTVPSNVSATAPNCSQANISWTASTDAGSGLQSYVIFRDGGFWREVSASSTATVDTSVSASTSYSYAVAAKDNFGYQSAGSSPAGVAVPSCSDTTVPSVPTNVVATAVNCAQVNVKWNLSTDSGGSGLKGYEVYRSGIYIGLVLAPATNLIDNGVAASTSYSYRVSSLDNADNFSIPSAAASVATPACPDLVAPTVPGNFAAVAASCSQVSVSWSASTDSGSGVQSYLVYKNGTFWREVSSPALSTTDTAVSPSTSYSYSVAAKDVAGNQSANTTAASATVPACPDTTAPTVPANVLATAASCSQVNVSWAASTDSGSGVQSYLISRNGIFWREVTTLSTTDTSVSASTSYSYAVAAKDVAGNQSANSTSSSATTPGCPDTTTPSLPTNVMATALNCSQVRLSWNASTDTGGSGLKGYEVYRNGVYIGLVLAPATNLTDSGVAASTSYSYRVSSFDNANNISVPSAATSVTTPACPDTTAPTVPGNLAATATSCSQVGISWSASTDAGSGVQSYLIYKNGTFWREVTTLSTIDTSVSASTSYSYAVAAKDVAGNQSATSAPSNATTPACPDTAPPTIPANVTATVASCSRVDVTWTASTDGGSGVKGYRVYRNGNMLQEVMFPALSFSDTTVAGNTAYSYAITAFDNAGNVSSMSTGSSATPPPCTGVPGRFVAVTLLGGTDSDYGMTVAADPNGNFMAGGSVAGRPYFAKLSPSRQILWSYSLANAGSVQSVAFDPSGDVVVTGYFYATADFGGGPLTSAGGYDLFVAKYSSGGVLRWANRYGSSQSADFAGDESGNSVAIDSNGNIAVAGSFLDTVDFGTGPVTTRGGKDAFVVKLNSSGVATWTKTFGNSGTDDSATSVRFDAANNLFVGGRFSVDINLGGTNLTSVGSYDVCVAKFSPTGAHLWSKRAGGGGYDTVRGLAVDPAGDLLVTGDYRLVANFDGVAFTGAGEEDVFLLKYTGSNGTQQWAKSFGSWNTDNGHAVGADSDRNIVIAGRLGAAMNFGGGNVSTPRSGFNIYVAKFDPSGNHLWSKALGNGREDARGVAFGVRNYPFIAGRVALTNNFGSGVFTNYGNNLNPDMMVLELEP